jgi:uncharacterized protein (DUF1697 family)
VALIVFLRAVNVGKTNRMSVAELAKSIDAVNIGAAGTLVVTRAIAATALRREIQERVPFAVEMAIEKGSNVLALVKEAPFSDEKCDRRFVTVMLEAPKQKPRLPIDEPPGDWQVRIVAIRGRCVLSLFRRRERLLYPNQVIEKRWGVRSTTRDFATLEKAAAILTRA